MPKQIKIRRERDAAAVGVLKKCLQDGDPRGFERLTAALVSRLLNVPVYVAKTGFQFGADAGTAGSGGRHIRVECKRYSDTTSLDARDLKGGLLEATVADPALEAWIVASTRLVNETDRASLIQAGKQLGVVVAIVDWTVPPRSGLPPLAALCSAWPDVVRQHFGSRAATVAAALHPQSREGVEELQRELALWNIGFTSLIRLSHDRLRAIWNDVNESRAHLNQKAAGGAEPSFLRRAYVIDQLDTWLTGTNGATPVALVGAEGTGKTWAALDWLQKSVASAPIVLTLPSSAFCADTDASHGGVREFLARSLYALEPSFDAGYWQRRIDRLLLRPIEAGPVFLLLVDGLNQRPEFPWSKLVMALSSADLAGRICLVLTCRTSYFREDLSRLRRAAGTVTEIAVQPYSLGPSGELERMLKFYGKELDDLRPELQRLAATPRLFPLVMRLAESSALQAEATVHRLLWEYGRDVLASRMDPAFDEQRWGDWLAGRARAILDRPGEVADARRLDGKQLAASVSGPDSNAEDVRRRLSELVDGEHWIEASAGQVRRYELKPAVVALGLGLALLDELRTREAAGPGAVRMALESWLEPVGALDESSQIVRAALSIVWAEGLGDGTWVVDELLVAWMHAQNPNKGHRAELKVLGSAFPLSLMTVIERSPGTALSQARIDAATVLRELPLDRSDDWRVIGDRMVEWCSRVDCPKPEDVAKGAEHYAAEHAKRIQARIGVSSPGTQRVMGLDVQLGFEKFGDPAESIPTILEGHEVASLPRLFAAAAVSLAINSRSHGAWEGLKWLLAAGCTDRQEAITMIRGLSAAARVVDTEIYVMLALRDRVAALLLWLVGEEEDDRAATRIDPGIDSNWNYAADYLASPATSFFSLERRHAGQALVDRSVGLHWRLGRASRILPDPSLPIPRELVAEVTAAAKATPVEQIGVDRQQTAEEHGLNDTNGALARIAPRALCALMRRRVAHLAGVEAKDKFGAALRAREFMLLVDRRTAQSFGNLRKRGRAAVEREDAIADVWLMEVELARCSGIEQLYRLADAQLEHLTLQLIDGLAPIASDDLYRFVSESSDAHEQRIRLCLSYLASRNQAIDERLFAILVGQVAHAEDAVRVPAFAGLARAAPERLGAYLLSTDWRPSMDAVVEAHHGSSAVIAASRHLPFEQVIPRVAAWRLLEAAAERKDPVETRTAVKAVTIAIGGDEEVDELVGQVTIHVRDGDGFARYSVSERPVERDLREELMATHEAVQDRYEGISNQTQVEVEALRKGGAKLYLFLVDVDDVRAAWRHAQQGVRRWLTGLESDSLQFRRRLWKAEGLFLALCEVLLTEEPRLGSELWRCLRRHGRTRFSGRAGVGELVHLAFRAPPGPEVLALRQELIALTPTLSDKDLLDVVIAAQVNRQVNWIQRQAREDDAASEPWRRKRAIVLRGLCVRADVRHLIWPEGEAIGRWQDLSRRMKRWCIRDALARHWWGEFVNGRSAEDAFAAWQVFLTCADRRSWVWIHDIWSRTAISSELDLLKSRHFHANKSELERAMRKREEDSPKYSEKLFGEDMPGTWLQLDGFVAQRPKTG
jgi:hypothetical protein